MAGTQSTLFETNRDQLTPTPSFPRLARSTDPETSHRAALEMETSGQRETDEEFAFRMVARYPDSTAAELEAIAAQQGDRRVSKRLSGLEKKDRVFSHWTPNMRKCGQTGRPAKRWRVVQP